MGKLYFISGVHGVGKTTLCNALLKNNSNLNVFTASSIIRKYSENDSRKCKLAIDPEVNQEILINGLEKERGTCGNIILDGHTVIRDANMNFIEIDINVFFRLKINALVGIIDSPNKIFDRLNSRHGKEIFSVQDIDRMQQMELSRMHQIGKELGIEKIIYNLELGDLQHAGNSVSEFLNLKRFA